MTIEAVIQICVLATQALLLVGALVGVFTALNKRLDTIHIDLNSRLSELIAASRTQAQAKRANPPVAYYNVALPSLWWDPTVVVPGLPTPHNGL